MDGFNAIKEFRTLLNKKDGLKQLTVVALVVDYQSVIRNYSDKERPNKAMDTVFQSRIKMLWNSEEVQAAAVAYKGLQFNLDIEEKIMLDEMRSSKIKEIQEESDSDIKIQKTGSLKRINDLVEAFDKKHGHKDLFTEGPVRNGYALGRLEQKLLNKNSFYYVEEHSQNTSGSEKTNSKKT
jgi:hypothetical protein